MLNLCNYLKNGQHKQKNKNPTKIKWNGQKSCSDSCSPPGDSIQISYFFLPTQGPMGVPGFQGNDGVPVSKAKSNHQKVPSLFFHECPMII